MTQRASDDKQYFESLKRLEPKMPALTLFCAAAATLDEHMAPCPRRPGALRPLSRREAKMLALVFHPDKTAGLSRNVQAVCKQVFTQFIAPSLESQDRTREPAPVKIPARKPPAARPAYKPAQKEEFAHKEASFRSASPWADVNVELLYSRASQLLSTLEKEMGLFDDTKQHFGVAMGARRHGPRSRR